MRGFFLAAAVTTVVALAGCGGDSSSPAASTESPRPLSRHQFEELERLYKSQVAAKADSAGDVAKAARATRRACRRTDRDDRLLAAIVASCHELLAFLDAMTSMFGQDCAQPKECAPLMRKAVERLDGVLAVLGETEQVVDDTVADDACRRALTTPQLTEAMHEMRDAMDEMATAMGTGEQKAVEKAGQRFIEVAGQYESASDVGPVFRRFRQACAPGG